MTSKQALQAVALFSAYLPQRSGRPASRSGRRPASSTRRRRPSRAAPPAREVTKPSGSPRKSRFALRRQREREHGQEQQDADRYGEHWPEEASDDADALCGWGGPATLNSNSEDARTEAQPKARPERRASTRPSKGASKPASAVMMNTVVMAEPS